MPIENEPSIALSSRRAGGIGPLTLLVLQPTAFCNIDCAYCYLPDRSNRMLMSDQVLQAALTRTFASGLLRSALTIAWHSGEPLAAGKAFFERANGMIARFQDSQVAVKQQLQTNAMLIDDAWCDLFLSFGFQIGVSLDGPAPVHDKYRRTRSQSGTFSQVMKGVQTLQRRNIDFSVLAVLTADSMADPVALLDFFEANNLRKVGFNLEEIGPQHPRSSFRDTAHAEKLFRNFAEEALRRHSTGRLAIREIAEIEQRLGPAPVRKLRALTPLSIVTVGVDGAFSTFCPELHGALFNGKQFLFGNVNENGFLDILSDDVFHEAYADIADGVADCAKTCDRFEICRSLLVANKLFENGSFASTETLSCRTRVKMLAALCERRVA